MKCIMSTHITSTPLLRSTNVLCRAPHQHVQALLRRAHEAFPPLLRAVPRMAPVLGCLLEPIVLSDLSRQRACRCLATLLRCAS